MGANHVAARVAFDHGVDVTTAVAVRSIITALVVGTLIVVQRVPVAPTPRQRRFLLAIGVIVGVQSLCLYSAVARLPVALALLAFNTYPLWTALWARLLYAHRPERRVVLAMPVMLIGLGLALDVLGAASGSGRRCNGSASAPASRSRSLPRRASAWRSSSPSTRPARSTAACARRARWRSSPCSRSPAWPGRAASTCRRRRAGWWGLALLTLLYGTGITILFTVLPRLGVVGNSAIMNVEPVFALVLAWADPRPGDRAVAGARCAAGGRHGGLARPATAPARLTRPAAAAVSGDGWYRCRRAATGPPIAFAFGGKFAACSAGQSPARSATRPPANR